MNSIHHEKKMGITTASQSLTATTDIHVTQQQPWIFPHFQKDKLKYSERYHQKIATTFQTSSGNNHQSPLILIPDGPFLRKYLGFLEELLQNNVSLDGCSNLTLLLLESAAECMDLRNSSPVHLQGRNSSNELPSFTPNDAVGHGEGTSSSSQDSTLTKEASSVNERSRIMKLWQKCNGDSTSLVNIVPYPDLTYRNKHEDDDFDLLSYADMSVEDRSRCSLVRAAHMYSNALSREFSSIDMKTDQLHMRIVLLTEDKVHLNSVDLREVLSDKITIQALDCSGLTHLLQEKISCAGCEAYDNKVPDDHWVNLQQNCEEEYQRRNRHPFHKTGVCVTDFGNLEHLKEAEQVLGLKQKRFYKGKLKVMVGNPKEAFVSVQLVDGKRVKYLLNGNNGHFNRALHEDTVVIEPLPEEEWEQPVGKVRLMHESDGRNSDNKEETSPDHPNLNSKVSFNRTVPTAHVVAIHNNPSQRRKFVATLQPSRSIFQRHESSILVVPMDKRISKIRIKTNIAYDKFVKKRLLVGIDGWDVGSNYPRGHFVNIVGEVGDLETEVCTRALFLFFQSRRVAQSIVSDKHARLRFPAY